jgi:DNA-binding NarL/FixJ family response regulator
LVVDDQPSIRTGLRLLIDSEQPRLRSVGAAGSGAEALLLVRLLQPELVLLDVDLAGEDGLSLIALLRREAGCRVVVLTSAATPQVRARALQLGARACLSKTAPAAELLQCLLACTNADEGGGMSCPGGSECLAGAGNFSDGRRNANT